MRLTDALLGEHGVLYALFAELEREVPRAATLAEVKARGSLLLAGIESHASIEDDMLFPALEPHIGEMGPLGVMRWEHREIGRALEEIRDTQDLAHARDLLLRAIRIAVDHFAKEERVLFPLAEQVLGEQALLDLGQRWAERRSVTVETGPC